MQSVSESKQELEASIRYAENAISSAKQTIESMEFRQEMAQKQYSEQTGREQALQNQVGELKSECSLLAERIDEMKDAAFANGKTIEHLKDKVQGQYDDIKMLERDLTVKEAQASAWKKKVDDLEAQVNALEQPEQPTMPVIPKDVAIAIFREGVQHGVEAACTELDGQTITVEESEYYGHFEVSFTKEIDLDDELDLDWMRGKVGRYDEGFVVDALKGLCADKEFECRIHGVDDQEEKKND